MSDRSQPFDLSYAPASYPAHAYKGEGEIVRVVVGSTTVGHLTRQGGAVGWLSWSEPWTDEGIVRRFIEDELRSGAALNRPLVDTWAYIVANVQHDAPITGPLDGLQGLASG